MNKIKITITDTTISTDTVVSKTVREFTKDSESIKFLKQIDNNKMQRLLGIQSKDTNTVYKPTLIMKNPKSQYGVNHWDSGRGSASGQTVSPIIRTKDLYYELAWLNDIKTNVEIEHI